LSLFRTIAYIDGHNLYHGLRAKKWARYYWLDLQETARRLLNSKQTLVHTKYFTTVVPEPRDRRQRHLIYIDALKTLPDLSIHYGHFLSDKVTCHKCGCIRTVPHEKMTDVNIATQLLADAFQGKFDTALLISADSDLVPPIRVVRKLFPEKRIVAVFPPKRHSAELSKAAYAVLHLDRAVLGPSQFPNPVVTPSGRKLYRPSSWK
jgi:uncharacterized LabA/DUF88 family protein